MKTKDPETPAEWQEAVDAASWALAIHSAVLYGLVEMKDKHGRTLPGSGVDADRCVAILEQGKALGILPRREEWKRTS